MISCSAPARTAADEKKLPKYHEEHWGVAQRRHVPCELSHVSSAELGSDWSTRAYWKLARPAVRFLRVNKPPIQLEKPKAVAVASPVTSISL